MENKMSTVAKLLGVELEEKFMLKDFQHMYKLTEKGLMYWSDNSQIWENSNAIGNLLTGDIEIVKLQKPILTEKEKEYLSAVIKPFRDRILNIYKFELSGYEGIGIELKFPKVENRVDVDAMTLPSFEIGTMYKGMELAREYSLEELEL